MKKNSELVIGDKIEVPVSHTDRRDVYVIDRMTATQYVSGSRRFRKTDLRIIGAKYPSEMYGYQPKGKNEMICVETKMTENGKVVAGNGADEYMFAAFEAPAEQPQNLSLIITDEQMRKISNLPDAYMVVNVDRVAGSSVVLVASEERCYGHVGGALLFGGGDTWTCVDPCKVTKNFTVTGFGYTDPVTGNGLWLTCDPSITDDGEHFAARAVDIDLNNYMITWDMRPHAIAAARGEEDAYCNDGDECDWDKYTVEILG